MGFLKMIITKCDDPAELSSFLRLDYANNLYFFTYLNEILNNSSVEVLIAKYKSRIVLALLLTPIHCCISSSDINYVNAIADQLPIIHSVHVVGRKDLVEHLLRISKGPERDKHIYSFCEYTPAIVSNNPATVSQKAAESNLKDLIKFYSNNDMLIDAASRLPAILSWCKAYFIYKDHEIVSCALTTTQTNDAAMIGSVYTIPGYRNHGYAKDCVSNLCRDLTSNHIKPYLFYKSDDDFLAEFYKSLGFRETNTWILATSNRSFCSRRKRTYRPSDPCRNYESC